MTIQRQFIIVYYATQAAHRMHTEKLKLKNP